jgi:hypothetical protein
MSMQSPTDAEAFFDYLGDALRHGERETPLDALVDRWRTARMSNETRARIEEGIANMEAGLGRPAKDIFADLRKKHGIAGP